MTAGSFGARSCSVATFQLHLVADDEPVSGARSQLFPVIIGYYWWRRAEPNRRGPGSKTWKSVRYYSILRVWPCERVQIAAQSCAEHGETALHGTSSP